MARKGVSTYLDELEIEKLKKKAKSLGGISIATLIRMWVVEKLKTKK